MLDERAFPTETYLKRQASLAEAMAGAGLQAVLLTSPQSIYYFCGFQTTAYYMPHALLFGAQERVIVVRDYERSRAANCGAAIDRVAIFSSVVSAEETIRREFARVISSIASIGYEDQSNFFQPRVFSLLVSERGTARLVPFSSAIDRLRRIKSDEELECSRSAGLIASTSLASGISLLAEGQTERTIASAMFDKMLAEGADVPASFPYAYFGPHAVNAMQQPTGRKLHQSDVVYLECAASVRRYSAALLRTGSFGPPSSLVRSAYDAARWAFETMESALRPGAVSGRIDGAASEILDAKGLEQYRFHRGGYSIGIGFAPGWGEANVFEIKKGGTDLVETNMVFHLVVILLIPEIGAIGLSDTFQTTDGAPVALTKLDRDFFSMV